LPVPMPNLKSIRLDRGLTRRELAEMTGCSHHLIRRAEGQIPNAAGLQLYNALAIADTLGVSLDYLCGRGTACHNSTMQFLVGYRRPQ